MGLKPLSKSICRTGELVSLDSMASRSLSTIIKFGKSVVAVEHPLSIIKTDAVVGNVIGQKYTGIEKACLKVIAAHMAQPPGVELMKQTCMVLKAH
jgi:hypothetical protein